MLLVEGDVAGFGFRSCATRFSPLRFDLCVLSVWHLTFSGKSCSLFAAGIRAGCCERSSFFLCVLCVSYVQRDTERQREGRRVEPAEDIMCVL